MTWYLTYIFLISYNNKKLLMAPQNLQLFMLGTVIILISNVSPQSCWRDGYNRFQVPQPPCPNANDDNIVPSWVCYSKCNLYYSPQLAADPTGVKCYKDCLKKWSDSGNGDFCSTSGDEYWRGSFGYWGWSPFPVAVPRISQCETDAPNNSDSDIYNHELGCEEVGPTAYPKCSPGYQYPGELLDLPNKCYYQGGCPGPYMSGGGSPCNKNFYNRIGHCPTGLFFGTNSFCYPKCINGYDGGNICYQTCPAGTIPCGDVLCLADTVCPAVIPTPAVNVKTQVDAAVTAGKQFSIEEIVRAEGPAAIALAGQMCNSPQTFAQIDAARTASYNCFQRRFPAFLGSSSGITQIEALELDPNGKIAVGGQSTDSSIFGSASSVFVGIYDHHGFNFTWVVKFPGSLVSVSDLIFQPVPTGTQPTGLLVLFRSTPVTLALIQAVTGTIQATLEASSASITTDKAYRLFGTDPVTGWISFASQDYQNGELTLVGLNLFRNPTQTSFNGLRLSGSNIQPHSVAVSSDGLSVYVSGVGQFSAPVSGSNLITFVEYSVIATETSYSPSYVQNYFLNKQFTKPKMDIFGTSVFMVAQQEIGSTETGLLIMQKVAASYSLYNYFENNNNDLKLIDVKGITTQTVYILLINLILHQVRFLEVSFVGGGQVSIIEKILKRPYLLETELLGARLQINREFYLFGTRTSYSTAMNVGGGSVGYFTYSADNYICGAIGTTATFHISSGTAFTDSLTPRTDYSGSFTGSAQIIMMTQLNPTVALIDLGLIHQLHNIDCYKSPVMPALSPISIKYTVDFPEIQFDYTGSYLSPNYCNGDFIFWYSLQNPLPLHQGTTIPPVPVPQPTGPIFYFDWIYPKFKIWIPHPTTHAGLYSINVIGHLPNHQVAVGPTFQIEVYNIPSSATITASFIPDLTYVVSEQQQDITWQAFAPSEPHQVIYYLDTQDVDGLYSQGFEAGVFNFTQGQKEEKLAVYTQDNSKAKIYNIRIRGKYTPRTPMQCVSNFKVIVLHQCFTTKITPSFLPTELVFEMSYRPLPRAEVLKFDDWKESVGICKPFIYKAMMAEGSFLPTFIQFFPNIRQFSVQQTPEIKPGSYLVFLKGVISGFYLMKTVAFTVNVKCYVQLLESTQKDQTINYIVGSPAVILQIGEFVQYPRCGQGVDYEARLDNGSPLPKAYFTFNNDVNSLGIREVSLLFWMNEAPRVDSYKVQIRAKVENKTYGQKLIVSSLKITFKIKDIKQAIQADQGGNFGGVKLDTVLNARIDSIDAWGVVEIRFSLPVQQINNLAQINEDVMILEILSEEKTVGSSELKMRNLNFTWICINMTTTKLKLQLNFTSPESVSLFQRQDELKVTFMEWAEILFQPILSSTSSRKIPPSASLVAANRIPSPSDRQYDVFKIVKQDTELFYPMPVQVFSSNTTLALNNAFGHISTGMKGSIIINFFLAVVLKFSMKYVWGILHFLQIVTHMPMLIPILPANYQVVLKLIYDVARLNIIPREYIAKAVKWLKGLFHISSPTDPEDPAYENLGNILLALTVASIALIVILVVQFIAKKFTKFGEKIDTLKYKIMFGVFITTITNGHMNMCVKMLGQLTGQVSNYRLILCSHNRSQA